MCPVWTDSCHFFKAHRCIPHGQTKIIICRSVRAEVSEALPAGISSSLALIKDRDRNKYGGSQKNKTKKDFLANFLSHWTELHWEFNPASCLSVKQLACLLYQYIQQSVIYNSGINAPISFSVLAHMLAALRYSTKLSASGSTATSRHFIL